MYGHGGVDVGVGRTQGVEGGLKGVEVRKHPFGGDVQVMEVGGLRFTQQRLHVKQANHLVIGLHHPITKASYNPHGKGT